MVENGTLSITAIAVECKEGSLSLVKVSGDYKEPVVVALDWPDDK